MTSEPVDVSTWTRLHADKKHPFWWGILCLIVIETTVVFGFLLSFFYLWIVNLAEGRVGWPPGDAAPPALYPGINTGLLIICSLAMWYGGIAMERDRNWHFVWTVVVCCVAGGLVAWFRWLQFEALPFAWTDTAYAALVWTLAGFHLMHVTSAVLGTAVIGWFAAKGFYTEQRRLGVQVDTIYWYFVSAIWVPIYTVLYWIPRWA